MLEESVEVSPLNIQISKLKPRRLKDTLGNPEVSSVEHPDFGYSVFAWPFLEWEDFHFRRQSILVLKAVMGWIVSTKNSCLLGTSECDLIWNEDLCKYNQDEVIWIRASPKSNDWSLSKKRRGHTEPLTHTRKKAIWRGSRDWSDAGTSQEPQRLLRYTRNYRDARKDSSLKPSFRRSAALPIPWFWTSRLQNWERINICCFKPPSWWYFVTAALGD